MDILVLFSFLWVISLSHSQEGNQVLRFSSGRLLSFRPKNQQFPDTLLKIVGLL